MRASTRPTSSTCTPTPGRRSRTTTAPPDRSRRKPTPSAQPRATTIDSQTYSPWTAFTADLNYGAGARVGTVGDAIFHCHLYPHFAAGFWALLRVHDATGERHRGDPRRSARQPVARAARHRRRNRSPWPHRYHRRRMPPRSTCPATRGSSRARSAHVPPSRSTAHGNASTTRRRRSPSSTRTACPSTHRRCASWTARRSIPRCSRRRRTSARPPPMVRSRSRSVARRPRRSRCPRRPLRSRQHSKRSRTSTRSTSPVGHRRRSVEGPTGPVALDARPLDHGRVSRPPRATEAPSIATVAVVRSHDRGTAARSQTIAVDPADHRGHGTPSTNPSRRPRRRRQPAVAPEADHDHHAARHAEHAVVPRRTDHVAVTAAGRVHTRRPGHRADRVPARAGTADHSQVPRSELRRRRAGQSGQGAAAGRARRRSVPGRSAHRHLPRIGDPGPARLQRGGVGRPARSDHGRRRGRRGDPRRHEAARALLLPGQPGRLHQLRDHQPHAQ